MVITEIVSITAKTRMVGRIRLFDGVMLLNCNWIGTINWVGHLKE